MHYPLIATKSHPDAPALRKAAAMRTCPRFSAQVSGVAHGSAVPSIGSAPRARKSRTNSSRPHRHPSERCALQDLVTKIQASAGVEPRRRAPRWRMPVSPYQ